MSVFTNSVHIQNLQFTVPSTVIDILELFFCIPQASPRERPKLRVIIVAKATNWVIFCNFPRAIEDAVHI